MWSNKILHPSSSFFRRQGCQWRRPYLCLATPAGLFTIGSIVKRDRIRRHKAAINRREAKRRRVSCESTRQNIKNVPCIALKKLAFESFLNKIVYLKARISKKNFFLPNKFNILLFIHYFIIYYSSFWLIYRLGFQYSSGKKIRKWWQTA